MEKQANHSDDFLRIIEQQFGEYETKTNKSLATLLILTQNGDLWHRLFGDQKPEGIEVRQSHVVFRFRMTNLYVSVMIFPLRAPLGDEYRQFIIGEFLYGSDFVVVTNFISWLFYCRDYTPRAMGKRLTIEELFAREKSAVFDILEKFPCKKEKPRHMVSRWLHIIEKALKEDQQDIAVGLIIKLVFAHILGELGYSKWTIIRLWHELRRTVEDQDLVVIRFLRYLDRTFDAYVVSNIPEISRIETNYRKLFNALEILTGYAYLNGSTQIRGLAQYSPRLLGIPQFFGILQEIYLHIKKREDLELDTSYKVFSRILQKELEGLTQTVIDAIKRRTLDDLVDATRKLLSYRILLIEPTPKIFLELTNNLVSIYNKIWVALEKEKNRNIKRRDILEFVDILSKLDTARQLINPKRDDFAVRVLRRVFSVTRDPIEGILIEGCYALAEVMLAYIFKAKNIKPIPTIMLVDVGEYLYGFSLNRESKYLQSYKSEIEEIGNILENLQAIDKEYLGTVYYKRLAIKNSLFERWRRLFYPQIEATPIFWGLIDPEAILARGGFDLVYVGVVAETNRKILNTIRNSGLYPPLGTTMDISPYALYRGLELARPGGTIIGDLHVKALVSPNLKNFRKNIMHLDIKEIHVTNQRAIINIQKRHTEKGYYTVYDYRNGECETRAVVPKELISKAPYNVFPLSNIAAMLIEKTAELPTIAQVARIVSPIYSNPSDIRDELEIKEKKGKYPLICGRNIKKFWIDTEGRVRIGKKLFFAPRLDILPQKQKWLIHAQKKIVLRKSGQSITAAYDKDIVIPLYGAYSLVDLKMDPYLLLGILNSSFAELFYRHLYAYNDKIVLTKAIIASIPIPQAEIEPIAKELERMWKLFYRYIKLWRKLVKKAPEKLPIEYIAKKKLMALGKPLISKTEYTETTQIGKLTLIPRGTWIEVSVALKNKIRTLLKIQVEDPLIRNHVFLAIKTKRTVRGNPLNTIKIPIWRRGWDATQTIEKLARIFEPKKPDPISLIETINQLNKKLERIILQKLNINKPVNEHEEIL